jgi:sugar phosphate isomerase/epimerase
MWTMKTSLITSIYADRSGIRDIRELIPAVAKTGIDAVEIFAERNHGRTVRHAGLDISDEQIALTRQLCDRYGLAISSISAHFPLISENAALRAEYLCEYKKCIDQAVMLGTPFVHGFSGDPDTRNPLVREEAAAWRLFREGCVEVLDYAQSKGIAFGMEPVVNHLVHGLASTQKMFDVVGRDDLYINYDPIHLYLSGQASDPITFVKMFGERIRHVHIHDGLSAGVFCWQSFLKTLEPDWTHFAPPGMGELDLPAIVAALTEAGYDGFLSIECIGSGYEIIDYVTWHYHRMMTSMLNGGCK